MAVATAVLVGQRLWYSAGVVGLVLLCYLAFLRPTRCRVETLKHRPCLWTVRGMFGTCDRHVGYKRGFPVLVRGTGFAGLPMFMWPRDTFGGTVMAAEQQPRVAARGRAKAEQAGGERTMMMLTAASVIIATVALVRDFVAG